VSVDSQRNHPDRLSFATLDRLPSKVRRPPEVTPRRQIGVVHLGIGAFHRAHQAVFTEDAAAAIDSDHWGILGVTQRSAAVRDDLVPQDGLFTVVERGVGAAAPRVVGAVRDVQNGRNDPDAVIAWLSSPQIRVVTLTVTEKGYRRAAGGRFDLDDPAVRRDIAGGPPTTVVGSLARGLQQRMRSDAGPVSVVCCDNLIDNGTVLKGLIRDFCDALPAAESDELLAWLDDSVRFPSSMVDRMVPATTERDRRELRALLGVEDRGLVVTEPFRQWVVTDEFATDRPPWELAGAILTDDVAPWEQAKVRLLNGTHSLLAYLGALRRYDTVAEAVADDELEAACRSLMRDDVLPTLVPPDDLRLADYSEQVLQRFANPALHHRTMQVAMDGSQKLPLRVLGTIRDRLAAGAVPVHAALAVAAWMAYVARTTEPGSAWSLDDPIADRLGMVAASADGDPVRLVRGLLSVRDVFGDDLAAHDDLRAVLVEQVGRLL
jgi:fructuronate reductase